MQHTVTKEAGFLMLDRVEMKHFLEYSLFRGSEKVRVDYDTRLSVNTLYFKFEFNEVMEIPEDDFEEFKLNPPPPLSSEVVASKMAASLERLIKNVELKYTSPEADLADSLKDAKEVLLQHKPALNS